MNPAITRPAPQQVMRDLRSGDAYALIEAMDCMPHGPLVDGEGNNPLHMVLLNPYVNHSAKLLEAVVSELLQQGIDPFARNKDGYTPRELAEDMAGIPDITDSQYGALNTVIWRLGEVEKQLRPEQNKRCVETDRDLSGNAHWAHRVLQKRQVEASRVREL